MRDCQNRDWQVLYPAVKVEGSDNRTRGRGLRLCQEGSDWTSGASSSWKVLLSLETVWGNGEVIIPAGVQEVTGCEIYGCGFVNEVVVGQRLDSAILEGFSSLNDSMVPSMWGRMLVQE